MAAALAADRAGVRPTLIDERASVGGNLARESIDGAVSASSIAEQTASGAEAIERGSALKSEVECLSPRIELLTETSVEGCFPGGRLAVKRSGEWDLLAAKQIIFATGTDEYISPFPGWTMPGVMTPRASTRAIADETLVPGQRVVVAGTGPYLLVVAHRLHVAGMKVLAVIESARRRRMVRHGVGILTRRGVFRENRDYLEALREAGIPLHWGHVVTEAKGKQSLESITYSRCNDLGQALGQTKSLDADALCVCYGFVPRVELTQAAGCKMHYDEFRGGWLAEVDDTFQTSNSGVRVAGDGGGAAGAVVAELEGTLAGLAAARDLGCLNDVAFSMMSVPVAARWTELQRSRRALDQIYRLPPKITDLATPETVVCRCSNLTRSDVEAGADFGGDEAATSQGCQARTCWATMAQLLANKTGKTVSECGPLRVRLPDLPAEIAERLKEDAANSSVVPG